MIRVNDFARGRNYDTFRNAINVYYITLAVRLQNKFNGSQLAKMKKSIPDMSLP